jgi:hypothetical protein
MEGLERINFDASGSQGFADRSKAGVVQTTQFWWGGRMGIWILLS